MFCKYNSFHIQFRAMLEMMNLLRIGQLVALYTVMMEFGGCYSLIRISF